MTRPARPVFPDASSPRPAGRLRPRGRLAATLAAWLVLAAIAGGGIASADDAEDGTAVTSEGPRKMHDEQSATKASRRKGVKSSASASGMMSGSAAGRGAGAGFGGGQGQSQRPSSQNGQFGRAGSGANSNAALQGQMKMKVSISTDVSPLRSRAHRRTEPVADVEAALGTVRLARAEADGSEAFVAGVLTAIDLPVRRATCRRSRR